MGLRAGVKTRFVRAQPGVSAKCCQGDRKAGKGCTKWTRVQFRQWPKEMLWVCVRRVHVLLFLTHLCALHSRARSFCVYFLVDLFFFLPRKQKDWPRCPLTLDPHC